MKPEKFNHEKFVERIYLNPVAVEEELAKNPSWMGYYGSQAAMWEALEAHKKIQRDSRAGEISTTLKESGEKGITDKYIEGKVKTDEEYKKFSRELAIAREQAKLYTIAHHALDKKQFSLQSLNRRNETDEGHSRAISFQSSGDLASKKQDILDKYR